MVTVPPTITPAAQLAQVLTQNNSVPVQLDVVSVTSTVAALQQRVVVSVLAVEVDLTQQLLNILTPQGGVTVAIPDDDIPQPVTLPNGQTTSLQSVLQNLQNLTTAQIKSGLVLQLDPQANANPTARLLLAPDALTAKPSLAIQTPTTPLATATPPAATGPLRTLALPLPPELVATLPQPAQLAAQAAATQKPDNALIAKFLAAVGAAPIPAATTRTTATPAPQTTPTAAAPATATPVTPVTLTKAGQPVEVLRTPQPNTIPATIVGTTARGDVIVQTAQGNAFSLAHTRGGAIGDQLFIRPLPDDLSGDALARKDDNQIPAALRDLVDTLETISPQVAARVLSQITLPLQTQSPAQVASTMMFFMSAMGGTFSLAAMPALHPLIEKMLAGKARDKLVDDIAALTRTTADAGGIEWRGHPLPTDHLDGLNGPIWFYVQQRQHGGAGGEGDASGTQAPRQTRFLIDLDLTRLGHTQLEGIASHGKVDLKLNTRTPLPHDMQNTLVQVYANAASAYGFAGELIFTNGALIDMRRSQTTAMA